MSLIAEIRRRKVFRVAVVYVATAFAVLQAANIMMPRQRPWPTRLRWFLAEFLVVVCGILGALAVDAWWEGRQEAEREEGFLRHLDADLAASDCVLVEATAFFYDRGAGRCRGEPGVLADGPAPGRLAPYPTGERRAPFPLDLDLRSR